jgi:phosphinothricin acetyltransferase
VRIRLMQSEDCEPIAAVLNQAIENGVAHFGTEPIYEEDVRAEWLATSEKYPWIVATEGNGSFLGFAKASAWKSRKAYTWTVESGVYIVDDAQGKGVGKALYTELFAILAAQGYRVVVAGVSVPNVGSERLHESMGFEIIGDIAPAGYKLGKWVPVRLYQHLLGACDNDANPGPILRVEQAFSRVRPGAQE